MECVPSWRDGSGGTTSPPSNGFCPGTTGGRTPASDAMFLAMARRSCAAIRDLGSLDLL